MNDNIIMETASPWGNITAYVENDGDTLYFSLIGPEKAIPMGETPESWAPFRSVWISNLKPVSASTPIDMQEMINEMKKGKNPIMPGQYCKNPSQPPKFENEKFQIVWSEEGDCAALLYDEQILAVITSWCSPSFSSTLGYSREFKGVEFLGMRSLDEILPIVSERIEAAKQFWKDWQSFDEWENLRKTQKASYEAVLGPHSRYFKIDGDSWPPKGLYLFEDDKSYTFITTGVCILAQPRVELFLEDPQNHRRAEWAMSISKPIVDEVGMVAIGEFLSKRVCIPWDQICWLGEGHSIDCDLFPALKNGEKIEAIILTKKYLNPPPIKLQDYRGDPVNILWAVPLTSSEYHYLQTHLGDELFALLETQGCSLTYKNRESAV